MSINRAVQHMNVSFCNFTFLYFHYILQVCRENDFGSGEGAALADHGY